MQSNFRFTSCLVVFAGVLAAQCPAIEFFGARSVLTTDLPNQSVLAAYNLSPGNWVAGRFPPYGNGPLLEVIPDYQRHLIGCFQKQTLGHKQLTAKDYSAGRGSQLAAAAEVTEGNFNFLWVGYGQNSVRVYAGIEPGNSIISTRYDTDKGTAGALFVDVNGDGALDLLTVNDGGTPNNNGSVSVLIGTGAGTFKPAVNYPVGQSPYSMATGDFNGDGKLDIVAGTNGPAMLLGNGDGTFKAAIDAGLPQNVEAVAAADLNGDGELDLAVLAFVNNGETLTIYLGNGNGTFRSGFSVPAGQGARYIAIGDFNVDGKADLAVSNFSNGTVSVFLGNGDGTFAAARAYMASTGPGSLVVTDINGDGNPDLVVANGTPVLIMADAGSASITTLLGNGDGTFQAAPLYSSGKPAYGIATADVNGDGKPDIVTVPQFSPGMQVYLNKGDGIFAVGSSPSIPSGDIAVALADFNGDGKMDAVLGSDAGNSGVTLMKGNGDGTFQLLTTMPTSGPVASIIAADLNGDGKTDIAAAVSGPNYSYTGGSVSVYLNNGGASFQQSSIPNITNPVAITSGDLNGDGTLDLVVTDSGNPGTNPPLAGHVYVLLGKGNGTFQSPVAYAAGTLPITAAVGDVNGDGKPDLVVATQGANVTYSIAVLLGNGDGTFKPAQLIPTDFGPTTVIIHDFSGDGKPDLIISHCCGATDMTYMLGNGDGTFQPEVHFNGGNSPQSVVMADFNGDGMPDLAVSDQSQTGAVAVLLNVKTSPKLTVVTDAGFFEGPLAPDSVAAGFGPSLTSANGQAATIQLPTNIEGTTVSVQDSSGQSEFAPLYFVSPGQINFQIPSGTQRGTATVNVAGTGGNSSTENVEIEPVAPSLFTLNANNLAAAGALLVKADKTQVPEPVFSVNSAGVVVPFPISSGSSGDQLFLTLYGTGFRHNNGLIAAAVAGYDAKVTYAGAQGTYPGLDQINIVVPAQAAKHGSVPVMIYSGLFFSNTVYVTIQ